MKQILTENQVLRILVIHDHESVLGGTVDVLQKEYPTAEFITAINVKNALEQIMISQPDLVVMDLSIPERLGMRARPDIGVQLLRHLMKCYPHLNILVQSAHVRTLVRMRPDIDAHKGGLTIADKSLSTQEMLTRVNWALQVNSYERHQRYPFGIRGKTRVAESAGSSL